MMYSVYRSKFDTWIYYGGMDYGYVEVYSVADASVFNDIDAAGVISDWRDNFNGEHSDFIVVPNIDGELDWLGSYIVESGMGYKWL